MTRCRDAMIKYLNYCGIGCVTPNEQCLIKQIAQQTYDSYSLKQMGKISEEIFKEVRGCFQKKAPK